MSNTFARDPSPRIQYSGDGGRTVFEFPFPVLADDDLLVFVNEQAATGFGITGLGKANGKITFAEPPAAGASITLLRRTEGIRETEFVDGGPFRAAAINAELDRIMLLIQEGRDEHSRALRAQAFEGDLDFCLPSVAQRANTLLGFDSAGRPMAFGQNALPISGNGSGLLVTPAGAITARTLGEHLATIVNVRDFGAIGDGVTDDSAAFQAAASAAQARSGAVYMPANPAPYVLGTSLTLDGIGLIGDGPGSVVKLSLAAGYGIGMTGDAPRISNLRVLGPAAIGWPAGAAEVDLAGVTLDAIQIAGGTHDAILHHVQIAACDTGLAIEGPVRAIIDCGFMFCRNGVHLRTGATGSIPIARAQLHACTRGLHADPGALFDRVTLAGGQASLCGRAIELEPPASAWRVADLSDLQLPGNLEVDIAAGSRHSVTVRSCYIGSAGKRSGTAIDLLASGETTFAPNLIVENSRADVTAVATVQLSGGTNLDLLQPGDLIVLASDTDDVDDLWTTLKAARAGIVHDVISQTSTTAEIALAVAAARPLIQASDVVRVVGRFGTATADSVGPSAPAAAFTWLRADDYSRVFAAHNPMAADQITLLGNNGDLRNIPGLSGEPVRFSGVELSQGAVNGALTRLVTAEIPQNSAVSFTPDSPIGMVHAFGHASTGDPSAAIFTYRADVLGYTELVAGVDSVAVVSGIALTGTSGEVSKFTFSAHTDGKIYVENRLVGPPRKVSLFVIGAPL
jgi:hypothetical protein